MIANATSQPLTGALEWIDRYADAVAQQLPVKQRGDIKMEVRSLLLDEVDARTAGEEATEKQVLEVIERYPSPAEMAKRYGATNYLIGPALYAGYVQTLRLVVTIVFILAVIGEIIDAAVAPGRFAPFEALWETSAALFVTAGIVTLVFAIVERSSANVDAGRANSPVAEESHSSWRARTLPPVNDPSRVTLTDSFADIVTSLVTVLYLTFIAARAGAMPVYAGGEWTSFTVLSQELLNALPWLIVLWAAELLVFIVVLALRRWSVALRLIALGTQLASVGILLWLLAAVPLTTVPFLDWIVRVVVIVVTVITSMQAVGQLWKLSKEMRGGGTPLVQSAAGQ